VTLADNCYMTFNVYTNTTVLSAPGIYSRWTGSLTGSYNGGALMTGGQALFEQFKLLA
jgi:hypothetical protein